MSLIETDKTVEMNVGTEVPDFILKDENGADWQLSKKRGKVIALLFYPADETLVCTKQLCSLRDNWNDYLKTGAEIIGICRDTVESHKKFAEHHHLPLSLLADTDGEVTKKFSRHWLIPSRLTRTVVIIDAEGIIRHRNVMFGAFRPTDKSVITAIYRAQYDNLTMSTKE